jgi:hypothetical protein
MRQTALENSPAEAFFRTAYGTFKQAAETAGGTADYYYRIGLYTVRFSFAGTALVQYLTRALGHLASEPSADPALTVCLFDSDSTKTLMPAPPWGRDAYGPKGEIRGFNTKRIRTSFEPGVDILNMLDADSNIAVYWAPSPSRIPYWETSFPMRAILHWWLRERPLQPIHSGAVGFESGGVLIAGKSGTGKSTTTLACLSSNLRYAGDDYVLAAMGPQPYVHSLYNTAKLDPNNLHRFPELQAAISNPDRLEDEKALLFLQETHPEKLISGFALRAILIPQVTGRPETKLRKAPPQAAFLAIVPTTVFQLRGAGEEAAEKIGGLVRRTPSYILEAGTVLSGIPSVIDDLLRNGDQ